MVRKYTLNYIFVSYMYFYTLYGFLFLFNRKIILINPFKNELNYL